MRELKIFERGQATIGPLMERLASCGVVVQMKWRFGVF
jgi:hypothetical protein